MLKYGCIPKHTEGRSVQIQSPISTKFCVHVVIRRIIEEWPVREQPANCPEFSAHPFPRLTSLPERVSEPWRQRHPSSDSQHRVKVPPAASRSFTPRRQLTQANIAPHQMTVSLSSHVQLCQCRTALRMFVFAIPFLRFPPRRTVYIYCFSPVVNGFPFNSSTR